MIRHLTIPLAFLMSFGFSAPVPETPYLKGNEMYWRCFLPGVVRPDAGTIEVVIRPDKPIGEFGNHWDFVFIIPPGQTIGTGANTLVGVYTPPLPEKGAIALLRTGKNVYRVHLPDFSVIPGKKMILALSWGRELSFAVNGKALGRTPMKDFPPEAFWPDHLRMAKFGPWNPQAIRISTEELREGDLATDPEKPFAKESPTSLIAPDLASPGQAFRTAWHDEKSPVMVKPAFRPEKQCYRQGEPVVFPVVSMNRSPKAQSVVVQVKALAMGNGAIQEYRFPLELPADSPSTVHELPLPGLADPEFHTLSYEITGETFPKISGTSTVAIFPKDRDAPEGALSKYYGVHHENDFHPDVFAKIDARTSRAWAGGTAFLWRSVEPAPGKFTWGEADAYVKECQSARMEILGVLGYPSRWASADPGPEYRANGGFYARPERWKPASLEAWGRYVRETVTRYKGRVKYWEIYNEVNFHPPALAATFSGTTEEYMDLMRVAYKEAKAADPACLILSSGFSTEAEKTMPIEFTKQGGAAICDIYNVHGYGGVEACAPFVDPFRKAKPGAPVWMTEQMWHELSDMNKRVYLAVSWPILYLERGYQRFINMGVRDVFFNRVTLSPNLDQWAIGVFQNEMHSGDSYKGLLAFPGSETFDLRHQVRRTDGSMLTVLGSETGSFEVHVAGQVARARDLYGHPIPFRAEGPGGRLLITNLAYVVSKEPLVVTKVVSKSKMSLLVNGQFEEVDGDIGMAGLASGKARHYVLRDKTYDKEGSIQLTETAKSGRFAMSVKSSGAGRVYLVQYAGVPQAGTYVVKGHFRRISGDAKPYLFLFDQDRNKVFQSTLDGAADEFRSVELSVPFDGKNVKPLGLGWGILSGAGEVAVDDVSFEPTPPKFDPGRFHPIPLAPVANAPLLTVDKTAGFNPWGPGNLSQLATGDRVLAGYSFRIGEAKDKSILILPGPGKNPGPAQAVMPVGQNLKALVFLHTALFVNAKAGEAIGEYLVTYQDGSVTAIPIPHREAIDDWYAGSLETPAPVAESVPTSDRHDRLLFAMRWANPRPDMAIKTLAVKANAKAVLVLVAASGEKP